MSLAPLTAAKSKALKKRLEIREVVMLSTAHAPTKAIACGELFDDYPDAQWHLYHQSEYGSGYYFGPDDDDGQVLDEDLREHIGPEMSHLFNTLAAMGFTELRFDDDVPVYPELPTYNWEQTKAA